MKRSWGKFLFILFLTWMGLLGEASGGEEVVLGPMNVKMGNLPSFYLTRTFQTGGGGEGSLILSKKTPGTPFYSGVVSFNDTRISLNEFLSGGAQVFQRNVLLKEENRLVIFLYGARGATLELEVRRSGALPEVSLTASPEGLCAGGSTTLSWSSTYATSATLEPGIGPVNPSDSMVLFPTVSAAYTITATGPGGSRSKSASVTVNPAPWVDLSANREGVDPGEPVQLSWNSANATSAILNPGGIPVEPNGSTTLYPLQTTTYTITAQGNCGPANDSIQVVVVRPPDDVDYGLDSDEQQGGGGLVAGTVRILNGNAVDFREDLWFPSPNSLGLPFHAFYNSRSVYCGSLGYGWSHTYDLTLNPHYPMGDLILIRIMDGTGRVRYFRDTGNGDYRGLFHELSHVKREGEGYVWHLLDGSKRGFSGAGRLQWIEDEKGNRLSLSYDAGGKVKGILDEGSGREITFQYSPEGRLISIRGPVTGAVPSGIWVSYGYDAGGNLISVFYADGSGLNYSYTDPEDSHNLTEKRNKAGHLISTWSYDNQDRATDTFSVEGRGGAISYVSDTQVSVADIYNTQRTYSLGEVGYRKRVMAMSGPPHALQSDGYALRWVYDSQMRLVEVEYPEGVINQFQDFDSRGNPGRVKLAVGTPDERVIAYTYHPQMRVPLSRTEPSVVGTGDKVTTWDYDNDYDAPSNESPTRHLGRIVEKGYTVDAGGSVVPYEYITTFNYNGRGQILLVDGPRPGTGDTTAFSYDEANGDLQSITRPIIGSTVLSSYDEAGRPGRMRDVNNQITTSEYDGRGRVTVITYPGNRSTTISYNTAGKPRSVTDEDGVTHAFDYDATYGRLIRITDPEGSYIQYQYDPQGNRIETGKYDPSGSRSSRKRWDYQHPTLPGKLWKEINADDSYTEYGYDGRGNISSIKDPNGNITGYSYDPMNRLIMVSQPGEVYTDYAYDPQGNLVSVMDGEGRETTYQCDDMGRVVFSTSPDTGTVTYAYDEAGNLMNRKDATGSAGERVVQYAYDHLNRLLAVDFPVDQDIFYTYDSGNNGMGRRTGMTDSTGSHTFLYNARGRLVEKASTIFGHTYTFRQAFSYGGRVMGVSYPSGRTLDYTRDSMGRMGGLSTTYNAVTKSLMSNMTYTPFGGPKGMSTGSGGVVNNQGGECDCVEVANPGSTMERVYTYDYNRNVVSVSAPNTPWYNETFAYDALNRLTQAQGSYGNIGYSYDKVGNRLNRTLNGSAETCTYVTGTNRINHITGSNPMTFTHDDYGHMTGMGTRTLTYNQDNRLMRVQEGGNTLGEYNYNGLGQRVLKTVNGHTTLYHYDMSGNLIAESNATGDITKEYLYMGKILMAMVDVETGLMYYYNNGHLGTPQIMTDETGTVVWEALYKPFGEASVNPKSQVVNNLRLPGQYYDHETGLHYNYHRYYDPRTGRYLTPDPIGLLGGINLYTYVNLNPVNDFDPFGLWKHEEHRSMTRAAMRVGKLFKQIDADRAMTANTNVDRLANQFNDPAHFMPGTKKEAENLIRDTLERAVLYELSGAHEKAMDALGEGLHTVQDRYAHYDQNAGWYGHLPFVGNDPDNPYEHPNAFHQAYLASLEYIDNFLKEIESRRGCE